MASRGDEIVAADLFTIEMRFEGANGSWAMVFKYLEANVDYAAIKIS